MNNQTHSNHNHSSVPLLTLIKEELLCHVPYGILAVALSMVIVTVLMFMGDQTPLFFKKTGALFHSLHFTHILFASSSVVLAFRKYSQNILGAIILGIAIPAVFCTLSDILMPYWGGQIFGLNVKFHLCFQSHLSSIVPFLVAGIINGLMLSNTQNQEQVVKHAIMSHFAHGFISAMASFLYLISNGLGSFKHSMGIIFVLLLLAVVIPCIISDILVPLWCARAFKLTTKACEHECKH